MICVKVNKKHVKYNNLYLNRNSRTRSSKLVKEFSCWYKNLAKLFAVKVLFKSGRRKSATTEGKSLDVGDMLEGDPNLSNRQISKQLVVTIEIV